MSSAALIKDIQLGDGSRAQSGSCRSANASGHANDIFWQLPVEVPVAILVNGCSQAVMMATPSDLEDMAIGFLLTEGYFPNSNAIHGATIKTTDHGMCVDVAADREAMRSRAARALEGRSGCGLCGVQKLTEVLQPLEHRLRPALDPAAVDRAFASLSQSLPLKAVNRSVHGAGFAANDGELLMVREDVGRHNALDKLAGALSRERIDPASGFAVMTSRCSFELVQKSSMAGLSGLATISAPTTLAVDIALDAGLPLAFQSRDGIVFLD